MYESMIPVDKLQHEKQTISMFNISVYSDIFRAYWILKISIERFEYCKENRLSSSDILFERGYANLQNKKIFC